MNILQLPLLSPRGLEMINSMGGGMVVASVYPASKIVVKPINCEYTSILVDNLLLLRTLRYVVCFKQMQCIIEALTCMFKTF